MAKRSQRRSIRQGKNQASCIWGFISIFDFRHGRSTRMLLSDRKYLDQQVGAGNSRSKLHMLTNPNEKPQEIDDGVDRGTTKADAAKISVKELMEEEMFSEQDEKKQMSGADTEAKESDSELRGLVKKNRKRTRKNSKSFSDIHFELDAAENLGPQNSCYQDLVEKSPKKLDLCDLGMQSEQTYSMFDKKLSEAIKVFTDGKHLKEDGKIDHSKEFMDALKTSSSKKELILKLVKDPNSLLVKHIEALDDAQLEKDRNSNLLARSELNNSKSFLPVARKQHNFFRRRSKSQEKVLFEGDVNCQTSNRIVILKPRPAGVQMSETEGILSSPLRSHSDLGTKGQTDRIASQFSFTEIKRKLKHAIGKEWHRAPSDDMTYRFPYDHKKSGNCDKVIDGGKGGWNSPNRNHFYNERFARPANKDKSYKPKETEMSMENETVEHPSQRVSNIYIEAKKHLSEILSNEDEFEDFSTRQLPETLGRILSLPDFNFSPICSPRMGNEHVFVTAQQRLSPYCNVHVVNEDTWQLTQENYGSHLSPSSQNVNSQSCISDNPEDKVQSYNSNSDVLDEINHVNVVEGTLSSARPEEGTLSSARPENSNEGDVVIVQTTNALVPEEDKVLDISAERCTSSIIRDQNTNVAEVSDEEEPARGLKLDSFEQDQLFLSPLTSPSSSSTSKHVGDLDSASERPERLSPVSVLEPLFTEDELRPASIKSRPVEPLMQPLRFHVEEQLSCAINKEICTRPCVEDEESAFEYVEAVLLASDLNWEEFLLRWISLEQILDPSLFDDVGLFSNRSCHDQKLLFDCTNEILEEVCEQYFGYSPWVSFVKHNIRPIPRRKDLIDEVWEGVEWHLLPQTSPCTLEQIVGKDMEKTGSWMDLRSEVESIVADTGEAILEELVEDAVLSFTNGCLEMASLVGWIENE